jgi:predicted alpha/beta-hydrolase family hydrolase
LKEQVALEAILTPALIMDEPVTVRIVPDDWPSDQAIRNAENPLTAMADRLAATRKWTPNLAAGSQISSGKAFDARGNLTEGGGAAGAGGLFGSFATALDPPPEAHLTAVWIDYVIHAPGLPDKVVRRAIVDLIGPAARSKGAPSTLGVTPEQAAARALAVADTIEIVPVVARMTPSFLAHLQLNEIARSGAVLAAEASGGPRAPAGEEAPQAPNLLAPQTLALARDLWSRVRSDVYLDRINVLTSHARLARDGERVSASLSFDIVENEVGVRPGAAADAFAVRLTQGVADTVAEALLLSASATSGNAAVAFAASAQARIPWIAVKSAEQVDALGIDADSKARIADEIKSGSVVIAPKNAEPGAVTAWWLIDQKTGTTLGMDGRGWGDAAAEFGIGAGTAAKRGEGYAEYVAILSLIMICSVSYFASTFNNALGSMLRRVAGAKQLCAMQEAEVTQAAPPNLGTETPVVEKQ